MPQSTCNNWVRRKMLVAINLWSNISAFMWNTEEYIMDPWPALYQNNNDYWCFTYDQKRSCRNFLQTLAIFTVSTACGTKTLQGRWTTDKSKVLLLTSSNATSSVRWTVNPFNDASSHLLTDRNKSLRYYLIIEDRGSTAVKVLCYKSEGRWFDPSWCHWNFSLT